MIFIDHTPYALPPIERRSSLEPFLCDKGGVNSTRRRNHQAQGSCGDGLNLIGKRISNEYSLEHTQ